MIDLFELNSPALVDLLAPELVAKLQRIAVTVKYADAQMIHSRGDDDVGMSIVRSGAVRIGTVGNDGSFLTTSILGVGQSFGEFTLFADLPRTHDATAVGETEVDQIPGSRFKTLATDEPDLTHALLKTALIRSHGLLELLDDMRRLALPVRTAKFLMVMSGSARNPNVLNCRQSELAFTLGVSRVSLGKALKNLAGLNLVELGYGKITLPSLERLHNWISAQSKIEPLLPGKL